MIVVWHDPIILFELAAAGSIVFGAFVRPNLWSQSLGAVESRIYRLAARPRTSVLVVLLLGLIGSAAVSFFTRVPEPFINDEFAHLLAADTFASGRLTNPTHPMWIHFETYHVNQKPTYVSKYPPAQGLILALGQIISGWPILGVWLSSGLACGAICWMLQGWFRPGVALLGALLAVFQIGILSYWTQSYWGGMMAALGSALVFGGLGRIVSQVRLSASITLGLGLAVLANSRPFEGFLASLPVMGFLLFWCFRRPASERMVMLQKVGMPIFVVGALTLLWMGYYNFRQTGNPVVTAYQVNNDTYQAQPMFRWGQYRNPPVYHHQVMHDYYVEEARSGAQLENHVRKHAPSLARRILNLWQFYAGLLLALPFVLGLISGPIFIWLASATVFTVCGGLLYSSLWLSPHYAAPMTGPFFMVVAQGWRRLRAYSFHGRRTGLFLARGIFLLCMVMLGIRILAAHFQIGNSVPEWPYRRAEIERQLEQSGGYHLIIVRYGKNHHPNEEWVYNRADIDRAHVVWAREMDQAHNQALICYFHTRSVWLLKADDVPQRLVPYPALPAIVHSCGVAGGVS